MFIMDEREEYAVEYHNITSVSIVKLAKEYAVKADTPNDAIILVRFNDKPKLGAIITSMWYANLRGMASWKFNDMGGV